MRGWNAVAQPGTESDGLAGAVGIAQAEKIAGGGLGLGGNDGLHGGGQRVRVGLKRRETAAPVTL